MISEFDPIIEAWYHFPAKAQKFKVTALDDDAATVEIQYFDGNIDEIDLDAWYDLDMERIEARGQDRAYGQYRKRRSESGWHRDAARGLGCAL